MKEQSLDIGITKSFAATRVKNKTPWSIVWRRLGGATIDWVLCGIVSYSLLFPLFYYLFEFLGNYLVMWGIPFAILFMFKDILVRGRSIGKRILALKIVSMRDPAEKISILRHLLRNISVLITPVEILMLLIFRNRIGDILAGTTVVDDGENSGW